MFLTHWPENHRRYNETNLDPFGQSRIRKPDDFRSRGRFRPREISN